VLLSLQVVIHKPQKDASTLESLVLFLERHVNVQSIIIERTYHYTKHIFSGRANGSPGTERELPEEPFDLSSLPMLEYFKMSGGWDPQDYFDLTFPPSMKHIELLTGPNGMEALVDVTACADLEVLNVSETNLNVDVEFNPELDYPRLHTIIGLGGRPLGELVTSGLQQLQQLRTLRILTIGW
jgi:hypothetical protein